MSRLRRLTGLFGLAVRRVIGRMRFAPQRVFLTALGVALAVGLMVTVTGISLGLASASVVESDDVQYWIVPENADVQTVAVSSGGVQLGDVHRTSKRIADDPRVRYAPPILLELLPVTDRETGEREYVLAVGTVAYPEAELLGLSTDSLTQGDPHYANGTCNGTWTGEMVFSDAAAQLTNASRGATVDIARSSDPNRTFTVTEIVDAQATTALGNVPVALMHLSELQTLTGATNGDQADQILVSTNDRSVRETLDGQYPRTNVVTRSGLGAQQVSTSNLPLAVAVAAFVIAVVVAVLFVTTLMGLEVSADRENIGTLTAVGYTRTARSLLIGVETVTVSLLGGGLGLLLGVLGIAGVNQLGLETVGVGTVAVFEPILAGYALLVAFLIGIIGALYPVVLSRRTDALEVLS